MHRKLISLVCGAVLAVALWIWYSQTTPPPGHSLSVLNDVSLMASLPGLFMGLLLSSGNHGIGLGITDNRLVWTTAGIATNALLYGWIIWFVWRRVTRASRTKRGVPPDLRPAGR